MAGDLERGMAYGQLHAATFGARYTLRALQSSADFITRNVPCAGHHGMTGAAGDIREAAATARLIADQLDTAADAAFAFAASNLTEAA